MPPEPLGRRWLATTAGFPEVPGADDQFGGQRLHILASAAAVLHGDAGAHPAALLDDLDAQQELVALPVRVRVQTLAWLNPRAFGNPRDLGGSPGNSWMVA